MSLIEQAAKRLEVLRRAGVDVAETPANVVEIPAQQSVIERAVEQGQTHVGPIHVNGQSHLAPPDSATAPTPVVPPARYVQFDLERMAASGIVTPDAPRSQIADEFRVVKRPLILNATGKGAAPVRNGNLIMVTSALPGEGKTFTAVNLAISIAMELDHTVLLVDADVARPSLPGVLGVEPARGLLDVLVDPSLDLGDVLLKSNVPKLTLLTSGTQHARATELLASVGMNRLLEQIGRRYADRIIVFDSPPLLVTTESRVLATHMGQVVIVVEAGQTSQAAVKHALATIEDCPVKLMMLNKGRSSTKGDSYGYGYGYGYGGYGYGK